MRPCAAGPPTSPARRPPGRCSPRVGGSVRSLARSARSTGICAHRSRGPSRRIRSPSFIPLSRGMSQEPKGLPVGWVKQTPAIDCGGLRIPKSKCPDAMAGTILRRSRPMPEAVIVEAVRTPMGRHRGALKDVRPDDLAALGVREVVRRAVVDAALVEEVYLGCANQAGEDNRNVARMAALLAGDRKSTRLNSSHVRISYAVFCLKKKKTDQGGLSTY